MSNPCSRLAQPRDWRIDEAWAWALQPNDTSAREAGEPVDWVGQAVIGQAALGEATVGAMRKTPTLTCNTGFCTAVFGYISYQEIWIRKRRIFMHRFTSN